MRRLFLWAGLVLAVLAAVFFSGGAMMLEIADHRARIEAVAPQATSTFKVHETVTLGRNGFAAAP
ncbi:MAG: hypothetical protein KatS3mg060_3734 [Dehalococcoidia bacterium]|nr:MAG: hypothetical protein KatS3mg060_3734 [Dehalococcoidia bacterium]